MYGLSESFEVKVEVHPVSKLSPLHFVTVLDALSKEIRRGRPWEMLYADDLVISLDAEKSLQENVGNRLTLTETGSCQAEVATRVKVAWYKWRELTPVICDKQMSLRLRAKVYKSMVRPVLLYGAEMWATRD